MPTIRQHTRKTKRGVTVVQQHTRSTQMMQSASIVRKADSLKWKLSMITGRGGFLSRPQKKAFKKAGDLYAKHSRILSKGAQARALQIQATRKRALNGQY